MSFSIIKKDKSKASGLFRKYFFITVAILLVSFTFAGCVLMLFVAGQWMDEKLDLLQENTQTITSNTSYILQSDYMGKYSSGAVLMIYNNISQASEILDGDFFVINDKGEIVYCKEILKNTSMMQDGECLIHSNYEIPDYVMDTIKKGETYRSTGNLEGVLGSQAFIVACPIMVNDSFHGAVVGTLPITEGLSPYILGIFRMFVMAVCFAFLLAFIIIYFVTYKLVKPLRQMSTAAKQYANGDFTARITIKHSAFTKRSRTEIDELADSFNAMAKDLAVLEESRRSFVSNVSHELKTPMTTIGGFIDGILDGTIGKDKETQYLNIVSQEVKRLSRLVTGMLNMTKIEAGKMDIKPVEFDISKMIFDTLLSFEQVLEKNNVEVRGFEDMSENKVTADKDMINQVVYNLVDNAVKFTPEGGYIEVSSKRDSEKIIVKVKNSGKGIASDELDKIFERFYKVDKSRSYDVKGAGLGLYLVKTILELHGGEIHVQSTEGEYAEFIFTLPLYQP